MVGLDFNGFLLMAGLLLGTFNFLVIALIQAAIALWRGGRAWRVAEAAALMGGLNVLCLYGILKYGWYALMWIGWSALEWAALLWLGLFVLGCKRLRHVQ